MPWSLRELGAADEVLLLRPALEQLAHPLARAVHRGRQRAVAGARERSDELVLQAIGAQRREPDLAAPIGERVHDLDDLRVIADRGADEADALRVLRDELEDPLHRRDAHAAVRRAAHHAVGAPREQPRSVSMRNMSLSTVCGVRMGAHAGSSSSGTFATVGRIAPWCSGTKTCGIFASAVEALGVRRRALEDAQHLDGDHLGLADDDRVAERRERQRVRERERAAGEHERMPARVALLAQRRDRRGLEHADEAGDLDLVGDAHGDDREVVERAKRLVADGPRLRREVVLRLVVEDDALAREARGSP